MKSRLKPFLRNDLDILFVGLNPAGGSSDNGHYFSVCQAFWNQLKDSGLITEYVDKMDADDIVFGDTLVNFHDWNYGITDLEPNIAESNSKLIHTNRKHCELLENTIRNIKPKVVILLHSIVQKQFLECSGSFYSDSNQGKLDKLIPGVETMFYSIAFPHGNTILSEDKVDNYRLVKNYLVNHKKRLKTKDEKAAKEI